MNKLKQHENFNTFLLFIHKNKVLSFLIMAALSWAVSVAGYYTHLSENQGLIWNLINGFTLSFADMPGGQNAWIAIGKILWLTTLASAIIFVALRKLLYLSVIKSIAKSGKEHVVVCGGINLDINNLKFNDQYVIVITNTIHNDEDLIEYGKHKIYFINADYTDETWQKVGVETSEYIIVSDESDRKDITIAKKINKFLKDKGQDKDIKIYVDLEDYFTMNSEGYDENIFFYNNSLIAARKLFQTEGRSLTYGVDTFGDNSKQVHLLIIGFGKYGQSIALEAIKIGHFYNGNSLKITIVDQVKTEFDAFNKFYNYDSIPDLDLEFKEVNIHSKEFDEQIIKNFNATYVVICIDNDNSTQLFLQDLNLKLIQNENFIEKEIPIAVRIRDEESPINNKNNNINLIKLELTTINNIKGIDEKEGVDLNDKARKLHEMWGGTWKGLSFHEKDKNYAPADHEVLKLDVIEHLIQKHGEKNVVNAILIEEEVEHHKFKELSEMQQKMIDMEHRRWNAYHYINGWIYGEKRNNDFKIHTCLVDTKELENLPQDKQDYYLNDMNNWRKALEKYMEIRNPWHKEIFPEAPIDISKYTYCKTEGKYKARISCGTINKHGDYHKDEKSLGYYETLNEAKMAYLSAKDDIKHTKNKYQCYETEKVAKLAYIKQKKYNEL